jgi:hypothetical protein
MIHIGSPRLAIATGARHAASAVAGASASLTIAENSTTAALIIVVAGILTAGLTALAREWFWISALHRPARNLSRIRQLAVGSAKETEQLMRLLQEAENNVLTARAACQKQDLSRQHQHPAGLAMVASAIGA